MKYFGFVLLVLFSFFLFSCSNKKLFENVDYIKVENYPDNKIFYGVVKSSNSTILSFQSEGKITYFPYTTGDFIKKGQVIAKLDNVLYEINKNEQVAKLEEYIVKQNRQKKYYDRLDVLHKVGAISDNDWEDAYFELKALAAQINVQKEKIKYINKEISYSIISAPFDGYISNKYIDNGSYAKVASPVVEFISSDGFQVETMVGQEFVNKIKINDIVFLNIQEKQYRGRISHISKSSLNSGGYLVKISFNQAEDIKEGMSAKVKFDSTEFEKILIPADLIIQDNEEKFVIKIEKTSKEFGFVKKNKVETGQIIDDKIEILNGLKKGDLILLNPYYLYKKVKL